MKHHDDENDNWMYHEWPEGFTQMQKLFGRNYISLYAIIFLIAIVIYYYLS